MTRSRGRRASDAAGTISAWLREHLTVSEGVETSQVGRWHRVEVRRGNVPVLVAVVTLGALLLVTTGCGSTNEPASDSTTSTTLPTATAPARNDTSTNEMDTLDETSLDTPPKVAPELGALPAAGPAFRTPVGRSGLADPADWPDACRMLTAEQLRAIATSASAVTAKGHPGRLGGGRMTPHDAACTYELAWSSPAVTPGTVTIELRNVGSADILQTVFAARRSAATAAAKQHPGLFADYGTKLGGASCFFDGTVLECVDGTFSFWVGGTDPRPAPPTATIRADQWRNRVLAKVVAVLAAKMTPAQRAPLSS